MATSPSSQPASNGSSAGGCASVIGVLILIGLAVEFWYVTLAIVLMIAVVVLAARRRKRRAARHRTGPADPWLNEITVALADLSFREHARNQRRPLGGVPVAGDIELRSRFLTVLIARLGTGQATHRAEMGLRADENMRRQLAEGRRTIATRDGVLFLATARGRVVDEALLDEVVRVVDRLPVDAPDAAAGPSATCSAAGPSTASRDVLGRLRELAELHRDGILDDAEFADKKAALLKRL